MGLTWGKHSTVKNGTLIVISAKFPEGKKAQEDIWNLWKLKKEPLKADGFSVGKDKKDNQWKISYFHTINEDTYEKTISDQHMWRFDLDRKIKKWESILENVRTFINEKTESDVLDSKTTSKKPKNENDGENENENEKKPKKVNSKSKVELEYENNDDDDLAELERILNKNKI